MPATPSRGRATAPRPTPAADRTMRPGPQRRPERRDPQYVPGRPADRTRTPAQTLTPVHNRVRVLLVHIPRLSIRGQARLAAEVGVSRSTISRLVNGRINPSYRLARAVTDALARTLGRPLDMREVFTTDGTYPTRSGCALCRCGGCLPDEAYDADGARRPEWRDARPGDWSMAPAAPQGETAGDEAGGEGAS